MKLFVYSSPLETARALIKHLLGLIDEQPDKIFNIAVSGGSTPARMFELWANEYANVTSWERIRIYWVDERCVPPESVDSNYGMTRKLLLSVVPVSSDHVFRIRGEKNPEEEAERDRKSTRLNSSHANISYAVFCLKKKASVAAPYPTVRLADED